MRRSRWRFKLTWPRLLITILLATAALALCWQGLLLAVDRFYPRTVTASYGTIEVGQWVEAVFVREETLLPAPEDGIFSPGCKEGERIQRSGLIGVLKSDNGERKILAPSSGLIVYAWDVAEGIQPEEALADPEAVFLRGKRARLRRTGNKSVKSGYPVAGLIDDGTQYLVVRLAEAPVLGREDRAWARLGGGLLPLAVVKKVDEDDGSWLVLRTDRFPFAWLNSRCQRVYLVFGRYTGTIIPSRFMRTSNGQTVVTVMVRGKSKSVEVEIVGSDRHQTAVRGIKEGSILLPR